MVGSGDFKLLRDDGKRLDGRGPMDLREISMKVGVLKQAVGSAMVQMGKNKVIAGVYGPREVFPKFMTQPDRALIQCRYVMAPFSGLEEHGRSGPNRRSQEISKVIKHVFENAVLVHQFPKTMIQISMEVLQSDGGTRVASLNAASLALIDAGLPVKDIVTAVSVGKAGGELVVDLSKEEDNHGQSDIPMAFSLRSGELLLYQMDGLLSKEEVDQAIQMGFEAAKKVREFQEAALAEKYAGVEGAASNGAASNGAAAQY